MKMKLLFIFFTIYVNSFNIVKSQLNFEWCCELGKRSATNSRLCIDYSSLNVYSPNAACKFSFTICCNQYNRNEECDRGKTFAFQQDSCFDASRNQYSDCDSFTDCCNCCQLGIQASKNNETCTSKLQLSSQCNKIQLDCCSSTQSADNNVITKEEIETCSSSQICPTGQICHETHTGPSCICPSGYEMNIRDNTCNDIDECKQQDSCPSGSTCENSIGSYKCIRMCQSGYVYNSETSKCKDINECAINIHKCATGMRCENIPGSYRCIRETPCGTGYVIESLTQECIDIDECAVNTHDCQKGYDCINVLGGFQCQPQECPSGYIFNFNAGQCEEIRCKQGYRNHNVTGKCIDINECEFSKSPCLPTEKCVNTEGSFQCYHVLRCETGFEVDMLTSECKDIDECFTNNHNCPQNAICKNKVGGFTCVCPKGYQFSAIGSRCEDLDECSYGLNCPRNSKCVNTVGSYECKCNTGFEIIFSENGLSMCQDINECNLKFICEHKCVNTFGSFQCTCNEGYTLSNDKRTCVDVDECQANKNLCTGKCINTLGSFECACVDGFELDKVYKRYCTDVDECKLGTHDCAEQDRCINVRGSFKCINITCPEGYTLVGGALSTRCERSNIVCENENTECVRMPIKINYHYITFTRRVAVPIKILKTPTDIFNSHQRYPNSISSKYEMKYISSSCKNSNASLFKPDFVMQYPSYQNKLDNSIELVLIRQPTEPQEVKMEITVETYINSKFSRSSLNVISLIITD